MAKGEDVPSWAPGEPPAIDPTKLTTDAVNAAKEDFRRELGSLKELLSVRIDGLGVLLHEELTDVHQNVHGVPQLIDTAISHLHGVFDEKFAEVELRFRERDARFELAGNTNQQAVAAALAAAKELNTLQDQASKEAAAKSEASVTKQLDSLNAVIASQDKAQTARLTELKERIDRGEGGTSGATQAEANIRAAAAPRQNAIMVALFGFSALLGTIGIIISLFHHP